MSENSKKASVLVSDKKPAFFEKNRFTGFYIFIVGHGQNIPKIPQNCILTTPCLKNSTSTSCATPLSRFYTSFWPISGHTGVEK